MTKEHYEFFHCGKSNTYKEYNTLTKIAKVCIKTCGSGHPLIYKEGAYENTGSDVTAGDPHRCGGNSSGGGQNAGAL
jgi:hypothetical protein